MATGRKTFVLLHGAWHVGWCWERVAGPLRAAGHRVTAPGALVDILETEPAR